MKKTAARKPRAKAQKQLSFESTLENIAEGMEYYALSVPKETTQAVGTRAAVPVLATVNGSAPFKASLYPIGNGRHYLRVRNQICKSVGIKKGDRVRVKFEVRDRSKEIAVPADVLAAARARDLLAAFDAVPVGQKSFMLRRIQEAVKPETREKRIQDALDEAEERAKKARGR